MIKTKSIAFKLAFAILASSAVIFLIIFGYSYVVTRNMIEKNIKSSAENLMQGTVNRIEKVLRPIEMVPKNIVYILESGPYDKNTVSRLLSATVTNNPEVFGAAAAFEPYTIDKDSHDYAPYFFKSGGSVLSKYLKGDYNYFYCDWYQIPKELDAPMWSTPYYDEGGGDIIMATYSVPLHAIVDGRKKVIGIATADISLSWLKDIVSSIKIGKTGYGFLISKDGRLITHPIKELVMNQTVFDVAEDTGNSKLRGIGRDMVRGGSGFVLTKSIVTGKKCWLAYAPLSSSGWSLGVVFPQDELMADIAKLNGTVFMIGMAGSIFLLLVIILISRSITSPILKLNRATRDIAKGNLDFTLPLIKTTDEVGELANSFLYMRTALKKYIKELTDTTAAKERIESELRIAHEIQLSLVPKIFPAYPDKPEFDIFAALEPAKEVGGDFYDFFFVDATRFCIAIGDVSGKGVPAALLMAVVKTLIKTYAMETKSPDITLSKINKELSEGNSSSMFVTIFIGIFDIKTFEFVYSNAGHNPPVLKKIGGETRFLETAGEFAVGIESDTKYRNSRLSLSGGDILCMYTDGVTEAFNQKREQFSDDRLISVLKDTDGKSLKDILNTTLREIRHFAGKSPQSDDITILLFKVS